MESGKELRLGREVGGREANGGLARPWAGPARGQTDPLQTGPDSAKTAASLRVLEQGLVVAAPLLGASNVHLHSGYTL